MLKSGAVNHIVEILYLTKVEEDYIPIGVALKNVYTYICDESLHLVNDGEIGELYIGGQGVSLGYLNNEQLLKSGAVNHIVEILYLTMFSLKQFISVTFFLSNKTNFPPFNKTPQHLIKKGIVHGNRIGVLVHSKFDWVILIIAIIKAGAAYVPVDPQMPEKYINSVTWIFS